MIWAKLDFGNLHEVSRQVSDVVDALQKLSQQVESCEATPPGTDPRQMLSSLVVSCQRRIASLEAFYADHDLHERASEVEQQRLKLKRAVRTAEIALQTAPPSTSSPPDVRRHEGSVGRSSGHSAAGMGMTQLKVRLTPSEFEELQQRRASLRQSKQHLAKGDGMLAWEQTTARQGHTQLRRQGEAGLVSEGPWQDPAKFSYRPQPDAERWITRDGFDSVGKHPQRLLPHPTVVTGPSAGPYVTSRAEVVLVRPNEAARSVDPGRRFTPIVGTAHRS